MPANQGYTNGNAKSHVNGKPLLAVDMKPAKMAVIGVGNIGATTAYSLALSGLVAEIVPIDVNERKAEGEAMELNHAVLFPHPTQIWAGEYKDCQNAAIVIIAAGMNQKPGQSRMDLLKLNANIFQEMIPQVVRYASHTILLAFHALESLAQSGTILDTARFRYLLGQNYGINPLSVHADIIGEHGETELPVWSLAEMAGMRLKDYCIQVGAEYDPKAMLACLNTTKNAARDIIKLKGMTDYGVAAGLVRIVETILRDENALLTVSTVATRAHIADVCLSVPTRVNRLGADCVLPVLLDQDEVASTHKSASSIKAAIDSLDPRRPVFCHDIAPMID